MVRRKGITVKLRDGLAELEGLLREPDIDDVAWIVGQGLPLLDRLIKPFRAKNEDEFNAAEISAKRLLTRTYVVLVAHRDSAWGEFRQAILAEADKLAAFMETV